MTVKIINFDFQKQNISKVDRKKFSNETEKNSQPIEFSDYSVNSNISRMDLVTFSKLSFLPFFRLIIELTL